MSGLTLRNRALIVAASAAVILPLGLATAGSASAVTDDLPVDLGIVDGVLGGGLPTDDLLGGGLPTDGLLGGDVVGGAVGTVGGLVGGAGLPGDPTGTARSAASDPAGALGGVTDGTLGELIDLDVLNDVKEIADLEDILESVEEIVNVEDVLSNIKLPIDLELEKLLNLPVRILSPDTEIDKDGDDDDRDGGRDRDRDGNGNGNGNGDRNGAVRAGALPKTGGSADMTAMLLCAGLAAAGAGVTLVTRRRNALGLGA